MADRSIFVIAHGCLKTVFTLWFRNPQVHGQDQFIVDIFDNRDVADFHVLIVKDSQFQVRRLLERRECNVYSYPFAIRPGFDVKIENSNVLGGECIFILLEGIKSEPSCFPRGSIIPSVGTADCPEKKSTSSNQEITRWSWLD